MSKQWLRIFDNNIYSPPASERLHGPADTESYPFVVELQNVTLQGEPAADMQYQLRCTLYDAQYRRFFGRAHHGKFQPSTESRQQTVAFAETVYFHIPYKTNNILLVVELVKRKYVGQTEETSLLGWTVLRLRAGGPRNDIPLSQLFLFQGSTQLLLFLNEPVESDAKLRKTTISLQYSLRNHEQLSRVFDFMPINTIVGSEEVVPGLEIDERHSCLRNPMAKMQSLAVIDRLSIRLGPMAERIEAEVCEFLNRERLLKDNLLPDGEQMEILEKRVRIGLHNGWSYLHEPFTFHLSSSDAAFDTRSLQRKAVGTKHARSSSWDSRPGTGNKFRLYLRNRVELLELSFDPGLGVVFNFELLVALQSSKPNPPARVVPMAWGVWSPFADEEASHRPVSVSLPLQGGPTRNPDGVLCFTDFYSLQEVMQRSNRPKKSAKNSAFVIQFEFNANPKKVDTQDGLTGGNEVDRGGQSHISERPADENATQTGQASITPPRAGRAPLQTAMKRFPTASLMSVPDAAGLHSPHPQINPYYWGNTAVPPAMMAFPYPAASAYMTETVLTGPIHAPLLALQQQRWRASAIPRNVMAMLDQAKFQPLVDRHGDSPELVDIFDSSAFSLASDLKDPLLCNEIIFQFLALGGFDTTSSATDYLFFTFQFYRFPQVTTERLLLTDPEYSPSLSMPLKTLKRVDRTGQLVADAPGFLVKFVVDPEYLKVGERKQFLEYLYDHHLSIDVWDGDSLMLIGTSMLPLRQLCRRNQEAVQAYCQLPLVTTEARSVQNSGSHSGYDIQSVLKGLLYVKCACVGYPSVSGVEALLKRHSSSAGRNNAVITHSLHRENVGVDLANIERMIVRPRSLTARGVSTRSLLINAKKLNNSEETFTDEKKRKLQRLDNIRRIETYSSIKIGEAAKNTYYRDIQTIKYLRDQTKEQTILTALYQSITTVHSIFPVLGCAEFLEYQLCNPYNEPVTISVEISDSELKLVTSAIEWQFFKAASNLVTPLDADLFATTVNSEKEESSEKQIFLKPRESVYIPLKYQTFQSIYYPPRQMVSQKSSQTTLMLHSKTVRVIFRRVDNGETVSILLLQIEPQPHIVQQTFRFYHPEQQFLAKYIRVEQQRAIKFPIECAFCTDPTVLCELRSTNAPGQSQDIYLKAGTGGSPSVKSFCILLYGDVYLSKPVQIWQVYIHSLQKIDISAAQGQATRFSVVLKGDTADRLIRCFASACREMTLVPDTPSILHSGATMEVQVQLKPMFAGDRTLQLTAVDVELKELLKSWLIYVSSRPATITKAFEVAVPLGQGKTLNKKIPYTNSYNISKTFRLTCSRPDLMTVKNATLQLEPNGEGVIGLRFQTNVTPQTAEILLFINNEQEITEDTFDIKASFLQS